MLLGPSAHYSDPVDINLKGALELPTPVTGPLVSKQRRVIPNISTIAGLRSYSVYGSYSPDCPSHWQHQTSNGTIQHSASPKLSDHQDTEFPRPLPHPTTRATLSA